MAEAFWIGVGSPVVVHLSRPVLDKQRAMVQDRLAVSTTPSVIGAWHWMNSQELHWRPPTYWKAGFAPVGNNTCYPLPISETDNNPNFP